MFVASGHYPVMLAFRPTNRSQACKKYDVAKLSSGYVPLSNLFLYAVAVLIWGSTWFAIEFQLGVVAPEVSIVYRYLAASFLL